MKVWGVRITLGLMVQVISCHTPKIDPVRLKVNPEFTEMYTDVVKADFTESEMPKFWNTITASGREFCKSFVKGKYPPKDVALRYLTQKVWLKTKNMSGKALEFAYTLLGCKNYFQMNDDKPDRDFRLAKILYPGEQFECFTVGFLQVYLMSSILPCVKTTALDMDWQILRGHYFFIENFKNARRTETILPLDDIMQQTLIYFNQIEAPDQGYLGDSLKMKTVCRYSQQAMCRNILEAFRKPEVVFPEVKLQLSFLKNADFDKSVYRKVIFVSNALDHFYTSDQEFNEFAKSVIRHDIPDKPALVIYHSGGWDRFGLYLISKKDDKPKIETICRDAYAYPTLEFAKYDTHFEVYTKTRNPVSCQWLVADKKI